MVNLCTCWRAPTGLNCAPKFMPLPKTSTNLVICVASLRVLFKRDSLRFLTLALRETRILYIFTVFYEVIQLRRAGQRIHPNEWPAPEFGRVSMATWRPGRTSLLRTARVATLYQPAGLMQRPALILIDPKITHLPLDGEVWLGTELLATEQGISEVEQAWLVRPRRKDAQPLPAFDLKGWREMNRTPSDPNESAVGRGWAKPGGGTRSTGLRRGAV